ncbi:cyclin G isoform X2 [Macrosteles quadrilineatus]|nr:cyclin G isoform X2 [Macrosteles quadrilineatus]XP_054272438.1 cyclin G isoform X2 [Macrosteles quadrilineatus]XP_054272440.1 cyclin G isoform X2 [Macrosteles quadrilineatus]
MDQGRPDALLQRLSEYLALELKFKPNLQLPVCSPGGEVTVGIRDGTANVLRCLKVWYDMPPEVLFVAVNLVDRFLTKMKARPKHMACIAIASFQLSCSLVCGGAPGSPPVPEAAEVAAISQCKCTPGDLHRMQTIITSKLGVGVHDGAAPITAVDFLRVFHQLFLSVDQGQVYARMVDGAELCQKLEIVACDAAVSNFRPCEIALVVICATMDAGVSRLEHRPNSDDVLAVVNFATQLQQLCKIEESSFYECHEAVLMIIGRYNSQRQMPNRQRLVWKLSHRTLRYLRPTDKLVTTLPTITEHSLSPARADSTSEEDSWSGDEWSI